MVQKGATRDGKHLVFQERPLMEISVRGRSGQSHPQLLSALLSGNRAGMGFKGFGGHEVFLAQSRPPNAQADRIHSSPSLEKEGGLGEM